MPEDEVLPVTVRVFLEPWGHSVPTRRLGAILMRIADEAAARIRERSKQGMYEGCNLAVVILDPTAPASRPSAECVLAIILIGDRAEEYLTFALDKAFQYRDHGMNNGAAIAAHKHLLADGATRWGHGVCVDGTYVGPSGLRCIEDRLEGTIIAAEFNWEIFRLREAWEEEHPGGNWYCNQDVPSERVRAAVKLVDVWSSDDPGYTQSPST